MTRTFTCIVCPNGCEITAEYEGARVGAITGATCPCLLYTSRFSVSEFSAGDKGLCAKPEPGADCMF